MDSETRAGRVALAVLVVVTLVAGPAAGALPAGNGVQTSGTVPLVTNTGTQVNVAGSPNISLSGPFINASAVEIATESGNATIVGDGTANLTIHKDNITGTWTNTSALEVSSTRVSISPEDKPTMAVEGDADRFNFTTPSVGDGNVDFVYTGASGTTTVEVHGMPASTALKAVDADTGNTLATGSSNSNGVVVFSGMTNSEHEVLIKQSSGGPTLTNPQPEGTVTTAPTSLSVDVDDPDFSTGETVDLTFRLDGSVVGTESTTSAGTVSTSISAPGEGEHDASVAATDSDGNTQTLNWTFSLTGNLTVRNVTAPNDIIDDRPIDATFYQNDTIINETESDGTFSLDQFNTSERLLVDLNASGYNDASIIIDDFSGGKTAYLQNDTASTVDVRFTLTDRTGQFENNGAAVRIQRPVESGGVTTWKTVHGDEFGPAGVTHSLVVGQRYRLVVFNEDGDQRILGTYVAEISETVPLTIGQVQALPSGGETDWTYNATYLNSSGSKYVQLEYNDTAKMTNSVTVHIFELGEPTNELLVNTTFGGPLGTFAISEPVPAADDDASWVVEVWVTREDGSTEYIREVVGPRQPVLPGMPAWLKAVISIGSLWIVAGLFSQVNGDVGALVISGMGGVFWYVDFLPKETGVGVVILALITAAIIFINERRGGGL